MNMSILFISHDLAVVKKIADYICIMKDSEIVEQNTKEKIFLEPQHTYTKELISAQTKKKSFIETITDISLGFIIYLPVNIFILPYFTNGIEEYSIATALSISAIYTSIAIARKYTLRRWFERRRSTFIRNEKK